MSFPCESPEQTLEGISLHASRAGLGRRRVRDMTETTTSIATDPTSEVQKGFWMHKDGTLWKGDAPYARADGVVPKASARAHLAALDTIIDKGLFQVALNILEGRGTAWVEALDDSQWNERLVMARSRVTAGLAGVTLQGKASTLSTKSPLVCY